MASTTAPEVSVSTVAATATSTGHHMVKIEGYKRLKDMHPRGKYFDSCRFQAAGHTWKISCYPNGFRAAGYMSLYLVRDDDDDEESSGSGAVVHTELRLALVYPSSRLLRWPPHAKTCTYPIPSTKDNCTGFRQFIALKDLERSGFLKDDCLAVRCDITVVDKSAVKDDRVKAADMERLGMLCKCNDDLCKRHHRRPSETGKKLRKAFVRFFRSIGSG